MTDTDPAIQIYLVRHAVAAERGDAWPDDSKRPLTPKGVQRFRRVVQGLRRLGVVPDIVLTSPFVRAMQTAEILAEGITPHPSVVGAESLAPGGSHASFAEDLGRHAKATRIACVGHEPDLGQLAARLIGARRPLAFKKGGVCRIDLEAPNGPGHLVWFAPPRLLRRASR
jgi:phosphohistidine phosphatase